MSDFHNYLRVISILLLVSVMLVTIFRSCKISPVLGYFVSGTLIAKLSPEIVEATRSYAEFGIVFLMFVVGLELTLGRVWSMRRYVFLFGSLQVTITALIIGLSYYLFSNSLVSEAFIVGAAAAMSSTAIVLQVLSEQGRQSGQLGRLTLATLLFQDLAVVPLLVLIPLMGGDARQFAVALGSASLRGAITLVTMFVLGRIAIRPLFRIIVSLKSDEVFISATLLVLLGTSYFTEYFGLSTAMGAFVAGLLMAETEYKDEIEHAVVPFKNLFLGLFFMTVGMSINIEILLSSALQIISAAIFIIIIKATVIGALCRLFKFNWKTTIQASLLLAQAGEFAFVLFGLALQVSLFPNNMAEKAMMIATTTMALTPLLAMIANRLCNWLELSSTDEKREIIAESKSVECPVVIIGFDHVGQSVARVLTACKISYVAFDISHTTVAEAARAGFAVYRGDATKKEIYRLVSVRTATTVIVTISNPVTLERTLRLLRASYPNVKLLVCADDFKDVQDLESVDKVTVLSKNFELAVKAVSKLLLEHFDYDNEEVSNLTSRIRLNAYTELKDYDILS